MSYILDALKKSEQQRQAVEPSSVSDRLLINQAETKSNFKKWWMMLMLGNALVMGLLIWYLVQGKSQLAPVASGVQGKLEQSASNPETHNQVETAQQARPVAEEVPLPYSPSIAEMMETEQSPVANKAIQSVPKQAVEKKQALLKKKPISPGNERYTRPQLNEEASSGGQFEPEPQTYRPPQEMPVVDQSTARPKLAINVFGYTQKPEDRFVIINMTKYKVGQQVGNGVELKAIHSDHIELQQGNASFKMYRP